MNKWLIAIIVLAVSAAGAFVYWSCVGDMRSDVTRLEEAVLAVLTSRGMTDEKIVSREEDFWGKGLSRGKTVEYTFNAGAGFSGTGLEEDLRDAAKSVRGMRLDKTEYHSEKDGRGAARYLFRRGKAETLSLTLKGVPAGWVKASLVLSKTTDKKIPATKAAAKGKARPKVVIVLDDFGYTKKNLADLKAAGIPVTLAVLPNTQYSKAVADFARANGMEVILHLPMEPQNPNEKLEKDTVKVSMKADEVKGIIDRAVKDVPSAKGISNHMGSKATSDEAVMRVLLSEVKKRHMFFLDSMTTDEPISQGIAAEMGVPIAQRDIFLDHQNDEAHITAQLAKVEKMALEGSNVLAIGHDRPMTVKVLKEKAPEMKKKGVDFVLLSAFIAKKE